MADNKKTFIFYSDWINMVRELPDKDAGILLKHILSYVNDENPETDNMLVKVVFAHMKPLLKADLIKWDNIREKRKVYGSKGGQAKAKQKLANAKQLEAVNVNVNDNDNVIVNDNKEKKIVFNFRKSLVNYGFRENLVTDWLKVRKTKKATNTETAYKKFILEVEKATIYKGIESMRIDKNELLEVIIENSWSGFKNSWLEKEKSFAKKEKVSPMKTIFETIENQKYE